MHVTKAAGAGAVLRVWSRLLVPAMAAALLAGCASQVSTADKADFHGHFDAGDYKGAAEIAIAAGQITPDGQTKNVVWSLNAGSALFEAGDMKRTIPVLDTTEKLAQANDLDHMHAAIDYRYTTYDGVMTNTYKALAYLAEGDRDDARVEFNRAEDRQRRAEERFAREIAAAKAHPPSDQQAYDELLGKAQQDPQYASTGAKLGAMAAYAPFENPFETYIAGIFFINEGDFAKGSHLLQSAARIMGPDSQAAADMAWAESTHAHGGAHRHAAKGTPAPAAGPQLWVVFENGQSATYHELRIVLPMVTGAPMTLALPVLAQNAPAYPAIQAASGAETALTRPAGDFDAVMASEFNRRRPLILAEAVAEVLVKNVGSVVAQKSNNAVLQLAMLVAANVSTADTRSWTALPKEFQAARLPVPADGKVVLTTAQGETIGTVQVPTDGPSIVYVKVQRTGAPAGMQVLKL